MSKNLDLDQEQVQMALAASNSKLNSNPICRTALHTEMPHDKAVVDPTDDERPSSVRFVEKPVELPPLIYFDCSKIRKVDTVFTRKLEQSAPTNVVEGDRAQSEYDEDTGDSDSQSSSEYEPQKRKCPQRQSSPVAAADLCG